MSEAAYEVGWYVRTCSGHTVGGDAAVVVEREDGAFLGIVDGLGHGPAAHEVARHAVAVFEEEAGADVVRVIERVHARLRGDLGAAAGACWYDAASGDARWAAVGNVVLRTFGGVETRIPGQDGIVGGAMPTPRERRVRLAPGEVLLLATDGVRDRLDAEDYPGLLGDSAPFVARRVVERFGREYDDATCVALRRRR